MQGSTVCARVWECIDVSPPTHLALPHDDHEWAEELILEGVVGQPITLYKLQEPLAHAVNRIPRVGRG